MYWKILILKYLAHGYFFLARMLGFRTTLLIERDLPGPNNDPPKTGGNVVAFKKKSTPKKKRGWL